MSDEFIKEDFANEAGTDNNPFRREVDIQTLRQIIDAVRVYIEDPTTGDQASVTSNGDVQVTLDGETITVTVSDLPAGTAADPLIVQLSADSSTLNLFDTKMKNLERMLGQILVELRILNLFQSQITDEPIDYNDVEGV